MEDEIESLGNSIASLTEKLDGVGIEIYHLSDIVSRLVYMIEKIADKMEHK